MLVLLLAVATLPPFIARALHSPVGDFALFSRIGQYQLEVSVQGPSGSEVVEPAELAPHLSRDARLVLLPPGGRGFGDDQADLVESGLADLGRLACALRPQAKSAKIRLGRTAFGRDELHFTESQTACAGVR